MGQRPRWTADEDRLLRSGVRELPGRARGSLLRRCNIIGISERPGAAKGSLRRPWSAAEILLVITGSRRIAGRTPKAVELLVTRLGLGALRQDIPAPWTEDEVAALVAGRRDLPGRTEKSVRIKCSRLGLPSSPDGPCRPWRAGEVALLRSGEAPAGRTASACEHKAAKLGFLFRPRTAAPAAPRPARGLATSVLHTAAPEASGYNLFEEILKAVGHGPPKHLIDEIVAEAACIALAEGVSAAEAVRRARPIARRLEQNPKQKQLDDCFWL